MEAARQAALYERRPEFVALMQPHPMKKVGWGLLVRGTRVGFFWCGVCGWVRVGGGVGGVGVGGRAGRVGALRLQGWEEWPVGGMGYSRALACH